MAVSEANQAMADSQFRLRLEPDDDDDPSILPRLKVAGAYHDRRGVHPAPGRRPLPWIEVRGLLNGDIEFKVAYNPTKPQRGQMSVVDVTKDYIEARVADLIDALNPRPK
jgi:hypothetical protein